MSSFIRLAGVVKEFPARRAKPVLAVDHVDLDIRQSEFISVVGPSGCGKSTLLHVLATLDAPDSGEVCFEGHRIDNLPSAGRDILRNRYFGMVFQFYHLLPELTTLENVLAPAMIGEGVLVFPCTLFHSMISRSATESTLRSSYLPSSIVWPLTFTQSSHNGANARCVGEEVKLLFDAEVLLVPKVMSPFVLT